MLGVHDTCYVAILNSGAATAAPDACTVTYTGTTIGGSDTFECYVAATPFVATVNGGAGWSAAARYAVGYLGQQAIDTFETYGTGAITTLADGEGWSGAWVIS